MSKNIGDRVRETRNQHSLNQRDFASRLDISSGGVSQIESGKAIPGGEFLLKINEVFGVDINWLLTGSSNSALSDKNIEQLGDSSDEFIYVDKWSTEASAGGGAENKEELIVGQMAFRKDWIKSNGLERSRLSILRAKGDSMEPTLHDGDALLVNTFTRRDGNNFVLGCDPETIKEDGIYIVRIDGHLMVKRLQRDLTGGFIVISDNPSYANIPVSAESVNDFCIAGRVVWAGGKL